MRVEFVIFLIQLKSNITSYPKNPFKKRLKFTSSNFLPAVSYCQQKYKIVCSPSTPDISHLR